MYVHLAGGVRGTLCGVPAPRSWKDEEVTCPECVNYLIGMGRRAPGERKDMDWKEKNAIVHEVVMKGKPLYGTEDKRFLALALAGEVGELLNLIKKEWRAESGYKLPYDAETFKKECRLELADIRMYLELLARCFDADLDKACEEKNAILLERWPEVAEEIKRRSAS